MCFQGLGLVALGSCLCCRKSGRKTDRNSSCSWTYLLHPAASVMKGPQHPCLVSTSSLPQGLDASKSSQSPASPTRLLEHGSALGQSRISALPSLQPFAKMSSNKPGRKHHRTHMHCYQNLLENSVLLEAVAALTASLVLRLVLPECQRQVEASQLQSCSYPYPAVGG